MSSFPREDDVAMIRGKDSRTLVSTILKKHLASSPMSGLEGEFEKCEVDPLLMLAIGRVESNLGNAYAGWYNDEYHNPFGLSSGGKLIAYDSWEDSIQAECELLKRIIDRGASNLSMLGAIYAEDLSWHRKVERYYISYWEELENY